MALNGWRQSDRDRFWKLHLMLFIRRRLLATPIFANVASGGGSFDADTTTWANQVVTNGGTVSTSSKTAVDALIKSIKADGNLGPSLNSVLDRLYVIANIDNDAIQSVTSIVNPGAAATTTGTITK